MEKLLAKMTKHWLLSVLIILGCLTYSMICNLQPPLMRACFAQLLYFFSQNLKLNLKPEACLLVSILVCLVFEPKWSASLSLLLSSTASLALLISQQQKNIFKQQLCIYALLLPLLFGWGNLHPLTILANVFLAPLISFILLPLALLTLPFNFLSPILDGTYFYLFAFLQWFSQPAENFQPEGTLTRITYQSLWLYFVAIFLFHHSRQICKYRDPQ